jgi:hypothetical protein
LGRENATRLDRVFAKAKTLQGPTLSLLIEQDNLYGIFLRFNVFAIVHVNHGQLAPDGVRVA